MRLPLLPALVALAACGGSPPQADFETVQAGRAVFLANCQACHGFGGGSQQVGPSLNGVVGRTAGTMPGFAYSDALKSSGIVWTEERLVQFLTTPNDIPGSNMAINPLTAADATSVIAYIRSESGG